MANSLFPLLLELLLLANKSAYSLPLMFACSGVQDISIDYGYVELFKFFFCIFLLHELLFDGI